nr:hypothetical protein CFP56_69614 [Quercus suber]
MERERSSEESDALERSTKKFKDNHCDEEGHSGNSETNAYTFRSYKDKLVGDIPGAYEQAFGFEASMEDEADSDCEESSLCEGMVAVSLSKEEKVKIREPWGNAIIVKTTEAMERERSSEESDALERSTKKFKDNHCDEEGHSGNSETNAYTFRSYKDKLVGDIPGAYEQAFGFEASMEDEADSDCEESSLCEGMVAVSLSKEEKVKIREPWGNAIIVKTFGRKVGFLFLSTKLRSMWRPSGRMDIIDLGNDFFLVKFELKMDLDVVLKGGPWFVGQQFLAIRKWEPEFKAEEATLSSVAVWIRLPGLPIEFYEPTILKKIGRAIGPVLRIDSFTANGAGGRFARLCVQIIIDQPLINTVKIGHRVDNCPAVVRSNPGTNTRPPSQPPPENQMAADSLVCDQAGDPLENHTSFDADVVLEQVGKVYGEWMVVARKKKPNGKNSTHSNELRVGKTKGQDMPPNPRDP